MAEIKIHRVKYWLNPKDPDFERKMRVVVGLYLNPPKGSVVLCLDEKTGIQAKEQIAPAKPAGPGRVQKLEWEYRRHGTVSLMASFEVRTGKVVGRCIKSNDSKTFIQFLQQLLRLYPKGKLYLVMDNGSSHVSQATREFMAKNRRLKPVYLPVHASWLNQIEIWFSVLARKSLKHVSFPSQDALRKQIRDFIGYHNRFLKHPYRWTYDGQPLRA
jgi:transposase